ncbi:CD0519/CD1768 family membrane protein [Wukongibacter baidiensis]|uniref:CD0519/CD1768 family membrane protein n=1 Tax=Wukongibacter baidiensis TaxID=1723361 RepID=UPI003D7F4DF5
MERKSHREALFTIAFLSLTGLFIGYLSFSMDTSNLFSSLMKTAYSLLLETAFYILAISVIMGAAGNLASEFGVVKILNYIFSPFMRPLYNLPGASFLGVVTTYLSDNPAVITLANDKSYLEYFNEDEVPCLCNLGTSFGMGLILTTFMIGFGFFKEALIGNLGAIIGSIVSVRIMSYKIKQKGYFSKAEKREVPKDDLENTSESSNNNSEDSFFIRFMTAMLEGGKNGVEMGIAIIPGLLFVCTIIMTLTFGPKDPTIGYQGLAFEGVALLPKLGNLLAPIIKPLFGFSSPEAIAFPITSLGAVGAAISLVPKFLDLGIIGGNDIAVFTAMGMCWSGYLSTHVGMMDALKHRKLISAAITSHTIGGLVAGISAHYIYLLLT